MRAQRPQKLVDGGNNTAINDPYYPGSLDIIKAWCGNITEVDELEDWIEVTTSIRLCAHSSILGAIGGVAAGTQQWRNTFFRGLIVVLAKHFFQRTD